MQIEQGQKLIINKKTYTVLSVSDPGSQGIFCKLKLEQENGDEKIVGLKIFFEDKKIDSEINGLRLLYKNVEIVEDKPWVLLEALPGVELCEMIDTNQNSAKHFTLIESAIITAQLASQITFIHQGNTIHSDLKPENIMVSRNEEDALDTRSNIIDFGLSIKVDGAVSSIGGTPPYFPLDSMILRTINYNNDVYSLGIVLCFLFFPDATLNNFSNIDLDAKLISEKINNHCRSLSRRQEIAMRNPTSALLYHANTVKTHVFLRNPVYLLQLDRDEVQLVQAEQLMPDLANAIKHFLKHMCSPISNYRPTSKIVETFFFSLQQLAILANDKIIEEVIEENKQTDQAEAIKGEYGKLIKFHIIRLRLLAANPHTIIPETITNVAFRQEESSAEVALPSSNLAGKDPETIVIEIEKGELPEQGTSFIRETPETLTFKGKKLLTKKTPFSDQTLVEDILNCRIPALEEEKKTTITYIGNQIQVTNKPSTTIILQGITSKLTPDTKSI